MLKLVPKDNVILKTKIPNWDFSESSEELIENMKEILNKYDGLGLAANQIGVSRRVFILGRPSSGECFPIFNPKIVAYLGEEIYKTESCLSLPGIFVKIKRYPIIRIRYQNKNAEILTEKFSGLTSQVIQHETDHLNGILITDRASRYHLDKAKKDFKKRMKEHDRRIKEEMA